MELFQQLIFGFGIALSWQNLLYCLIGVSVGTLIGVLPGIGPLGTIAILLPITFNVAPVGALIMLAGIYYGAQYGGSTTAILVNLPGETSSVVTCIDGYQMARQGRAGPALAIAAIGSFFAGTVGTLLIALFGPPLAEVALQFAAPEYFSLMLMSLVAAAVLAQGDMMKSIAMVALGLLLGIVGRDVNTGIERYSFGITELSDGIGFIVVAVGMFAMGEIISNLGNPEERRVLTAKVTHLFPTWDDMKQSFGPIIRGTALGSFFGVLPGTGPAIASFSSYMVEKKLARDPSRFGRGAIEGVAGPESANNADAQCKFIPMLTLGLPASGVMALMLGALTIQGIQPGPEVMTQRPDLFWGLVASMWIGVPPAVPGDHGVLRHRHLQRQQFLLRDLSDRAVRCPRLRVGKARLPAGAAAARLRAGPDDGGESAPRHADGAGRPVGLRHPADQPRLHHRHHRHPRRYGGAGGETAPRRDHGLTRQRRGRRPSTDSWRDHHGE
jgi:putative tricarboxylic transport membrane protein